MQPNLQRIADTCAAKIRSEQAALATLKRLAKKWPALVDATAHLLHPVAKGGKWALYLDSVTAAELAALIDTFKPLPLFWHADNLNGHGPRTTADPLSAWDTVTPMEPVWVETRHIDPNEYRVRWTAREVEIRASVATPPHGRFDSFLYQGFHGGYNFYYCRRNERAADLRAAIFGQPWTETDENRALEYL